jgi:hypothetical protein
MNKILLTIFHRVIHLKLWKNMYTLLMVAEGEMFINSLLETTTVARRDGKKRKSQ